MTGVGKQAACRWAQAVLAALLLLCTTPVFAQASQAGTTSGSPTSSTSNENKDTHYLPFDLPQNASQTQ